MQYILLIYGPDQPQFNPEEGRKMMSEYREFTDDIKRTGHFKAGDALQSVKTATTIRVRDGKVQRVGRQDRLDRSAADHDVPAELTDRYVFLVASALAVASRSGWVVTGLPVAAFIHASGRIEPSLQMRSNSFANVALSLPATCSST